MNAEPANANASAKTNASANTNASHERTHRTWKEIVAADPQHSRRYANRWRGFVREGRDINGEARLVDALVPRGARILDAGCGQGRVGGYLQKQGHNVVGVDIDPYLIEEAQRLFPDATWLVGDLAELPSVLAAGVEQPDTSHSDAPSVGDLLASARNQAPSPASSSFDLIICPGNVVTFIADEDRQTVLAYFAEALNPEGGRALIGFGAGRGWDFAEFEKDAAAAGLRITQKYATWDLRPFTAESHFLVAMCERR